MENQEGLEAVCRLIGMVSETVYPLEFRLAAIAVVVIGVLVVVDKVEEFLG